MTTKSLRCFSLLLAGAAAGPLLAQTSTQTTTPTYHTATAHRTTAAHHAVPHCAVPEPELSPKIPAVPAALGCPKVEYALTYIDTQAGTGELAQPRMWYTVNYTGYLTDGTKFDSSYDHGKPISFPYGAHQVIPGWDTGFEGMHVGGKRRLFVPYQLAYGEMGRGPIPPKAELIFDVELVSQNATRPEDAPPGAPPPTGKPQQ